MLTEMLPKLTDEVVERYKTADPFPHAVLDINGPLTKELLDVEKAFPNAKWEHWYRYNNHFEKKLAQDKFEFMPMEVLVSLLALSSAPFLDYLTRLTGIKDLIPDPYFIGGGMHMIESGGLLDIHTDFNYHRSTLLDRRLNVMVYLNSEWEDSWGGELELWDREMQKCVVSVKPKLGTMVVFTASEYSFHGHPNPVSCPADRCRKSIASYYYTNGRPDATNPHRTVFMQRPGEAWSEDKKEIAMQRAKKAYAELNLKFQK